MGRGEVSIRTKLHKFCAMKIIDSNIEITGLVFGKFEINLKLIVVPKENF